MSELQVEIKNSLAAVKDHSRQFSDFTFVYPVISRRSRGLSIGINLNPDKVCNFDCIYCEVDRRSPGKVSRVDLSQMKDELVAMIHFAKDGGLGKEPKFDELPSYITRTIQDIAFSGDGEPTMLRNFSEVVQAVAQVKQAEGLDKTKIVLITDSAGLDRADVQQGLGIMDQNNGEVWAKLDAGSEEYFRLVNRSSVKFDRILANILLTALKRPIIIQSLFLKVHGQLIPDSELEAYCNRLLDIVRAGGQIREVHAYTIARPTPEQYATALSPEALEQVAKHIRDITNLTVRTFA